MTVAEGDGRCVALLLLPSPPSHLISALQSCNLICQFSCQLPVRVRSPTEVRARAIRMWFGPPFVARLTFQLSSFNGSQRSTLRMIASLLPCHC